MNPIIPDQLIWWITAVDIPMISAFIFSLNRMRNSVDEQLRDLRDRFTA